MKNKIDNIEVLGNLHFTLVVFLDLGFLSNSFTEDSSLSSSSSESFALSLPRCFLSFLLLGTVIQSGKDSRKKSENVDQRKPNNEIFQQKMQMFRFQITYIWFEWSSLTSVSFQVLLEKTHHCLYLLQNPRHYH
jgi:hypothetical protein